MSLELQYLIDGYGKTFKRGRNVFQTVLRIRIDLALMDTDPYWKRRYGFRSKKKHQN
jgi:hypothetical protein